MKRERPHRRTWQDAPTSSFRRAGANLVTSLTLGLAYERPEPFVRPVFATGVMPIAVAAACGVYQVSDIERLPRRKPRIPRFLVDRMREVERAYLRGNADAGSLDLADIR